LAKLAIKYGSVRDAAAGGMLAFGYGELGTFLKDFGTF
jgi:hypothetical protein